ncbi:MAG TPA: hypothetical protein VKU41_22900 [Polyangiaceae bacterium]|nr:hypothetical protein [Polyangiaceae bacterium]
MTMGRVAWAATAVALLTAGPARASPEFPGVIRDDLGLSYAPACTLCHAGTDSDSGVSPATTPFARAAIERGLKAGDDDSLRAALSAMRNDRVDSAGDGESDIDKLIWGSDPNMADVPKGGAPPPPVDYGCTTAPPLGAPGTQIALLAGAGCLVTARRRSRRSSCATAARPPDAEGVDEPQA